MNGGNGENVARDSAAPSRRRPVLPYLIATATGIIAAWLVVIFLVFPVDPDVATPEIPTVIGESFEDAERKLMKAGFVVEKGEVRPAKGSAPGRVLEQVPAAGTRHQAGSKVVLHTTGGAK